MLVFIQSKAKNIFFSVFLKIGNKKWSQILQFICAIKTSSQNKILNRIPQCRVGNEKIRQANKFYKNLSLRASATGVSICGSLKNIFFWTQVAMSASLTTLQPNGICLQSSSTHNHHAQSGRLKQNSDGQIIKRDSSPKTSDSGYATQSENPELVSTSSDEEELPQMKRFFIAEKRRQRENKTQLFY